MIKIEIEIHDDVLNIINKLKNINDKGIELVIPEGSVLFENVINLKLLKTWAEKEEISLNFMTEDDNGLNLIEGLSENQATEEDIAELEEQVPAKTFKAPKFKMPRFSFGAKKFVFLGILTALLIIAVFFSYKYIGQKPQANVKVVVNSQPLTRSLEVKVINGAETSPSEKILKGYTVGASVDDEAEEKTTGEKIVGEKAKGVAIIFNNTDEDKKFKKGTDLTYKDDKGKEYIFELTEDVTVPAREEQDPDPENPLLITYLKGQEEADVEAKDFGEKYNIDESSKLSVEDQKSTEFTAEAKKDFTGGLEDEVAIVTQVDIDALKKKLSDNSEEKVLRALEAAIPKENKLITGSQTVQITKEELSATLNAEAERVTLKQTFQANALTYKPAELDALIDKIVKDYVPEGFVLSTKERIVNVEVLGNTDSAVVSTNEADLQVTLKTFVIPEISEESVKESLMGLTVPEAQKIIGSIRNIKTYEFNLSPRIPFFDYVPKDRSRINITIERE